MLAFIARVTSWTVTVPVAFFVADFLFPDNVICTPPWAGLAYAVVIGLASATSSLLEERLVPKAQPKKSDS